MIVEVDHPVFGPIREVASPIRTEGEIRRPGRAPRLGEPTAASCQEVLGYAPGRIAALQAAGAFGRDALPR
jgi:crotonobetainyl-CoA:carnitine CoA-transferase CaiB-like acyl-CoA transferase